MHLLCPASLALAFVAPIAAAAPSPDTPPPADIRAIRQEIDAMRAAYEARLQALEERLKAAEAAAAAPPPAPAVAAVPPPPAAAPTASAGGGGANAFNPAISLILSGQYARLSKDPANYAITGFQLPTDAE